MSSNFLKVKNAINYIFGALSFQVCPKSADPFVLDAYEEGTWTPTFTNLTTTGAGTYNTTARFTRIGNMVFASVNIQPTGGTTVASTANSTRFSLPIQPLRRGAGSAVSGNVVGYAATMIDASGGGLLWMPTIAATNDDINLTFSYPVA